MRVSNMTSPRTDSKVANQFVISEKINSGDLKTFQSYDSIIAKTWPSGRVVLDKHLWNYSRTTVKYLTQFLRYETGLAINTKKDVESKIKSGEFELESLDQQ